MSSENEAGDHSYEGHVEGGLLVFQAETATLDDQRATRIKDLITIW